MTPAALLCTEHRHMWTCTCIFSTLSAPYTVFSTCGTPCVW